jgi:hypothetical protein
MNYKLAVAILVVGASGFFCALPANSAQRPRHHHQRSAQPRPQPYIACTMLGCAPVPPGCMPIEGRTPGGMPTGFDVVACPPGVAPFR